MNLPTVEERVKYYMPLTTGLPRDGPSRSVFSVPKMNYSPQTESVVKNLMRESRLTFTQKHVFETILRDGKPIPKSPSQMMHSKLRQAYMQQRHRHKARSMGMELLEQQDPLNEIPRILHVGPHRRTYEAIKATGALDPPPLPHWYIPASKEKEKERLANRMAYGKDIPPVPLSCSSKSTQKRSPSPEEELKPEVINDLKQQRFEELIDEIQDRMQFLLTMEKVKMGKQYKDCIVGQINEKLFEMRKISPKKEKDVRDCLQLELIDKRLGSTFGKECDTAKFFDR